jgi:hypothetical protein
VFSFRLVLDVGDSMSEGGVAVAMHGGMADDGIEGREKK